VAISPGASLISSLHWRSNISLLFDFTTILIYHEDSPIFSLLLNIAPSLSNLYGTPSFFVFFFSLCYGVLEFSNSNLRCPISSPLPATAFFNHNAAVHPPKLSWSPPEIGLRLHFFFLMQRSDRLTKTFREPCFSFSSRV